ASSSRTPRCGHWTSGADPGRRWNVPSDPMIGRAKGRWNMPSDPMIARHLGRWNVPSDPMIGPAKGR
ncbi:MAG: hypothetical protein AAF531_17585, partial [Actinomycetota bacterium]